MLNKVFLIGNLGADPELKFTGTGTAVCDLRIATSKVVVDKDGGKKEYTEWHKVIVWGKKGESCKEYLSKGKRVHVEGRLQTRSWEDRDGNKRYTTEIVAEQVIFLSFKDNNESSRDNGYNAPAPDEDYDPIPF